ncbi:MAG: hypothetical protein M8364_14255 [Methylobacter sp.]|uniref:hypothetical protein n=1 Tax=Methylobacter sp. TaxID=2051955 RepID=UPI002588E4CD|nr:hypothetical protein [Methylobacter sp.]MCL7422058.1 hypothetical protein [Methylobacter sp.]
MIRTMLIVVILIGAMTGCFLPGNADAARAASPITCVTPNDPPVLTLHGTADTIVPMIRPSVWTER